MRTHRRTLPRSMPLADKQVVGGGGAALGTALVVAAAAVGGLTACGSSAAPAKPQTLNVLEVATSFHGTGGFDASGNRPPAVGQGVVIDGSLYKQNAHNHGARYGALHITCTFTNSTGTSVCSAVASLPGGTIVIKGRLPSNPTTPYMLPIVGASGRYARAKGHVRVRPIGGSNSNKAADTIVITP